MYYLFLSALCVALWQSCIAQSSHPLIGARVNGVGYAATCIEDQWSLFNNTAGLAGVKETQAGASYDATPGFPSFNRMAAVVTAPLSIGSVGLGFFRFGDDLYREQFIHAGYANKFGMASLGVRASFIDYYIEGFGRKAVASLSVGGMAEITPWLRVGACIMNAIQPEIAEGEKLGTFLMTGLALQASENATVLADVEHELGYTPKVKIGLEYAIHMKFIVRTGFNLKPQAGFFGFGFRPKKFHLDYAWSYMPELVSRHQVSFTRLFQTRK